MKILLAHKFYYPRGGPESVILQQESMLQRMGHTVIPFAMQDEKNLESAYSSHFVPAVDYHQGGYSVPEKLKTAKSMIYSHLSRAKIERLLDIEKPEIAHLHNIYHQISPSIISALKSRNIPVVMTLHDFKLVCPNYSFFRDGKNCEECQGKHFYKAVLHRCVQNSRLKSLVCSLEGYWHGWMKTYSGQIDMFITLSKFANDKFAQYGLPEAKLVRLPNCLDLQEYQPAYVNKNFVLFIGRLNQKYGIFHLLQSAARLPEISFKIAGNGEEEAAARTLAQELNLKNVEFLGFLNQEKLKQTITDSGFIVFPALLYHHSPMAILEAFALGKPAVASNLGSLPELVEEGKTGFLVETDSVSDLSDKIKRLHDRPELVRKFGENARAKMEKDHSAREYYPKLVGLYQKILTRGNLTRSNYDN
ncbi:MAG: glycosyltransferase family 4 protein [candidate division Zixibacteria bacterium]|nr:glycosyltransferase family 4 protein [candidate division Zixibacteria bacterium]